MAEMSLEKFKQNSIALRLQKRTPNMPMLPPASSPKDTVAAAREDHNPSQPASSQTSPAVSPEFKQSERPDTHGAFRCSDCEAFNDHAHYSRRKGGVICQVCGKLSNMMLEQFVRSSVELQRKILETAYPQDPGGPEEEKEISVDMNREEEETEVEPPPVFVAKKNPTKVSHACTCVFVFSLLSQILMH